MNLAALARPRRPPRDLDPKRVARREQRQARAAERALERQFRSHEKAVEDRLSIHAAHGNLLSTAEGTFACFTLSDMGWAGLTDQARDGLLNDTMQALVDLTGCRVQLFHIPAPWNSEAWKRGMSRHYPNAKDSFSNDIAAAAVLPSVDGLNSGDPVIIIAVRFTTRTNESEHLWRLTSEIPFPPTLGVLEEERKKYAHVARVMAGRGYKARRISGAGMQWAMECCLSVGHEPAAVGDITHEDIASANRVVQHAVKPYAPTGEVIVHDPNRGPVTRHVTVLHVQKMPYARDTNSAPGLLAWLTARRVPWAATFDIRSADDIIAEAKMRLRIATNRETHDRHHGVEIDEAVRNGIDRSREIIAELQDGTAAEANRMWGRIMIAASGDTPQGALDAADELISTAAREQKVTLVHDLGLDESLWRFTPGVPWGPLNSSTGLLQRLPLATFAALAPANTGAAGDRIGMPFGAIAESCTPYHFDGHAGPEANQSGVIVAVGGQGSGKTTLGGYLFWSEIKSGGRSYFYDPTGRLAKLQRVADIADDVTVFPLNRAGRPGILMPHFLDPEVKRRPGETDEDYRDAQAGAEAARMARAIDATMMCLPYSIVAADTGDVSPYVEEAVNRVGGAYGTDSREILSALTELGGRGREIASLIRNRCNLAGVSMVFPNENVDVERLFRLIGADTAGTIITMEGMSLPQSEDPRRWTVMQQNARPMLALGWPLAARGVWADNERKFLGMDEMGVQLGGFSSIGSDTLRSLYDSRKVNAAVFLAAQTATPFRSLDDELEGLVGTTILGRAPRKVAAGVMPLMGLPEDHAYASAAAHLEPGEFFVCGNDGVPVRTRLDMAWWRQDLVDALYTSPHLRDTPTTLDLITEGAPA